MRYKIITSEYLDVLDNDNEHIGTTVEYQWFEETPTPADFPGWDLEEETGDGFIVGKFDTHYDRNAEEHYPVYLSAIVEPDPNQDW